MKAEDHSFDSDIIRDLKNGDGSAMEMLYKLHWKALYISAYNVLKDREACEDIIQELFIRVWNNREQINITSSIRAYLSAATRYEVYRKIKETKRYEPIVDEMVSNIAAYADHDTVEYRELQQQINSVIDTLSPKCKHVYILSRNEQLSHKEIAGKLNISTKTVRNHLTHALHHLRVGIHQLLLLLLIIFHK